MQKLIKLSPEIETQFPKEIQMIRNFYFNEKEKNNERKRNEILQETDL